MKIGGMGDLVLRDGRVGAANFRIEVFDEAAE